MKKVLIVLVFIVCMSTTSYCFDDVDEEYKRKITPLIEKGVITGYPDNTIRKESYVTRASFCKMISVFFDIEELDSTKASFNDVDEDYWAYKYIMSMKSNGIVNGVGNNLFNPNGEIKYQDTVKMIIIAMGYDKEAKILGGYPKGYLELGKKLGIISNDKSNEFATRADVIDILLKINNNSVVNSDKIILTDYKIDNVITCRENGSIDGKIVSEDSIDVIKWAFFDSEDSLIMVEEKKDINSKTICLNDYLRTFDFSRLAVGEYAFKIYLKTKEDSFNIVEDKVVVVSNNNVEDNDIAILDMKYLNISQGIGGEGGHKGTYAIDLVGKDRSSENLYAPFDGIITKIYNVNNLQNFVWLESKNKIKYADGTYDYVTIMTGHDDNITNLYVGKEINKGDGYYQEGSSGKSTGNHIHLEVGKGKTTEQGWVENEYGKYHIENHISPDKVFYIRNSTTIINSMGLKFGRVSKTGYLN